MLLAVIETVLCESMKLKMANLTFIHCHCSSEFFWSLSKTKLLVTLGNLGLANSIPKFTTEILWHMLSKFVLVYPAMLSCEMLRYGYVYGKGDGICQVIVFHF